MLRGELLPNNSAVALEDIGIDENALLCLANHELRLHGSRVGHWYFPNQTQVDYRFYYYFFENGMYRNRGDGIVLLHRVSGGAEGIYRCEIPNSNWELQSLFVRVYSLHRGTKTFCLIINLYDSMCCLSARISWPFLCVCMLCVHVCVCVCVCACVCVCGWGVRRGVKVVYTIQETIGQCT